MVRTAGPQRPDRGTMKNLCPRRDYPMSTYATTPHAGYQLNAVPSEISCEVILLLNCTPPGLAALTPWPVTKS